jgi:hypothetical protein
MVRRISLWTLIGLTVACCWAIVAAFVGPTYNLGRWAAVGITAPASLIGRRMPLGIFWFILLNGGLYAIAGFAIEPLRKLRHSN